MEQQTSVRQRFAQANADQFAAAVTDLSTTLPNPNQPTIRLTLTNVEDGQHLKDVDLDAVNLWRLASAAHHRAERAREAAALAPSSVPAGKPGLRLVGGA